MMLFGMIMITVCNCLIFKTSVFKYFPMDVMAACALVPAAGFIIGKLTVRRPKIDLNIFQDLDARMQFVRNQEQGEQSCWKLD